MRYFLLAAFIALPAFAQTPDDAALSTCRTHSLTIPVADPGKLLQAQDADFQKCIAENIPTGQRREIALMREQAAICNKEADIEQKRESMLKAERDKVYAKCMAPRYVVQ